MRYLARNFLPILFILALSSLTCTPIPTHAALAAHSPPEPRLAVFESFMNPG
jgi:hypothetical protein